MRLPVFLFLLLIIPSSFYAATIVASSASRTDVGTAVASASNGDIVSIPAGSATWTNVLNITKAITLQGSGIGQTIIQDGVSIGALMTWTLVATLPSRLTAIEFSNNGRSSQEFNAIISVTGSNTDGSTMRVDHCKFDHLNGTNFSFESVLGVVDHNTFIYTPTVRAANVFDSGWNGGTYASGSWADGSNFGTSQFLFFEDNTFTYDTGFYAHIDGWAGARWVARYNTINNGWLEAHGTDSAGRNRGTRAIEVYNNTFVGNDGGVYVVNMRSGIGVIHNNTASGFMGVPRFEVANYRDAMFFAPWGGADGTNPWDKNVAGGPFGASPFTASSGTGLTVTVTGASWTTNQWVGYEIKRTTGKAITSVTRSGGTATVTTTASHGFSSGDVVTISGASPVDYNITASITVIGATAFTYPLNFGAAPSTPATGSIVCMLGDDFSEILSNTSTVITFLASGYGIQYDLRFATSDQFNLWKVDQAMDQVGVSGGAVITGDTPTIPVGWNDQSVEPCYEWNNTGESTVNFISGSAVIVENVHFFNDTTKPSYTPYTYPHPLQSQVLAPTNLRIDGTSKLSGRVN